MWPPKIDLNKDINCLRDFYVNMNMNNVLRYICAVCGQFFLDNEVKKFSYSIKYLMDKKELLHKNKLFDIDTTNLFKYGDEFEQLNDIVLDPSGFNYETKKVISLIDFNIYN